MDAGAEVEQEAAIDGGGRADAPGGLPGKRVFVSSRVLAGADVNSTADADSACAMMAKTAGLSGTWQAWISDGIASSPASRFAPPFQGPYVLAFKPSIQIVPSPDAFAKKLDHAIDIDENGVEHAGGFAWTQTQPNGDDLPESPVTGDACQGWASSSSSHFATVGSIVATSSAWTLGGTASCDTKGRIYCFEQ